MSEVTTKKTAKDTLEITESIVTVRNKKWLEGRKKGIENQLARAEKDVVKYTANKIEVEGFLEDLDNKEIVAEESK